jgi:phage anti-repressor protein
MKALINVNPYSLGDFNNGEYMLATELYEFLGLDLNQYSRWFKSNVLNNDFFESGKDYFIFDIDVELKSTGKKKGKKRQNAKLSLDMAKRIGMRSSGENAEKVRSYFLSIEKKYNQRATNPAFAQLQTAQALYEQSIKVQELENKVLQLEAKTELNSGLTGYYTIRGFCVIHRLKIDLQEANRRGRRASKLSRELDVEVAKQGDQMYGFVNAYREDILEEIFEDLLT